MGAGAWWSAGGRQSGAPAVPAHPGWSPAPIPGLRHRGGDQHPGMQRILTAVLASVLLATAGAAEFAVQAVPEQSRIRLETSSRLSFTGSQPLRVTSHYERDLLVLSVDKAAISKAKVVYGQAEVASTLPAIPSRTLPVAGRTYLVSAGSEGPRIAPLVRGAVVPQDQRDALAWDFAEFGAVHPIAMMLSGQTLKVGDVPASLDVVKDLIERRFEPYGIDEITELTGRVDSFGRFGTEDIMRVSLALRSGSSRLYPDLAFTLTGELVVAVPSGRPLGIQLAGPVVMTLPSEAEAKPATRRGRFQVTYASSIVRGPEAEESWDWDRDWRVIGGTEWHPLPRPVPRPRR
jgi:hypothetical protein